MGSEMCIRDSLGVLWEPGQICDDFGVVLGGILGSKIKVCGILFVTILRTCDFRNIAPRVGETLVSEVYGVKIRPKTEAERREKTGSKTGGFRDRFSGPDVVLK